MTRFRHPDVVALVLAAGQGTRMQSDLAKVLHPMAGQPLLAHVLACLDDLGVGRVVVVIGHQRDRVRQAFADAGVDWVVQAEQRGTGHAVQMAGPALAGFAGRLLIVCGDTPLLKASTLHRLIQAHADSRGSATVLSMRLPDPSGYGRIVHGASGELVGIVEERDATPDQRRIHEVNSGIYVFDYPALEQALAGLSAHNAQGEYYLTDTLELMRRAGGRIAVVCAPDYRELLGINTLEQLREAEEVWHALRAGEGGGRG